MSWRREFARCFDALPQIVAFTAEAFAAQRIDARLRPPVDLALEELFTNLVKYGAPGAAVEIAIAGVGDGVEVMLTESDAEEFDVTRAPKSDLGLPIELREPGGLGLRLLAGLLDSIDYAYSPSQRQGRIVFRKRLAPANSTDEPAGA